MDKHQHPDQHRDVGEPQDATILPFPAGHETPTSTDVDIDGQQVQIIYLPWRHEVDGVERSAGLYYRSPDSAGFYPTPTTRDLDELLNELVPQLRQHLTVVPNIEDREGV